MIRRVSNRYLACILCTLLLWLPLRCAAAEPRPGQIPGPVNAFDLILNARYDFPNAGASARAGILNPADSGVELCYALSISRAELALVSGSHEWPEADARTGESESINLWAAKHLQPGERIDRIWLSALPAGQTLPAGIYAAEMLIEVYDADTKDRQLGVFSVEVSVVLMVDERTVTVNKDGETDLKLYNNSDYTAAYMLAISAAELRSVTGLSQYYSEGSGLKERDTVVPLLRTEILPPYSSSGIAQLCLLPDGLSLPAGTYSAWLIRLPENADPYALARIELRVDAHSAGLQPISNDGLDAEAIAQAIVNAEYLLSSDGL